MTQVRSVTLFCTKGGADKTYQIHLRPDGDGYRVDAYNGRRGGTLTPQPKTNAPVAYDAASKIFDDLLKSKLKGGYTPGEDGAAYQSADPALVQSGIDVQLLVADDEINVERYIRDPAYVAQEKHDGERRPVQISAESTAGINKKGFVVPLPLTIADAIAALPHGTILDAEQVGDHLFVFDALRIAGQDLRAASYGTRRRNYEILLGGLIGCGNAVSAVETAVSAEEKRALYDRLRATRKEGIVFKRVDAPYEAGRLDTQVKIKFLESATVQVASTHPSKRSIGVQVFDAVGGAVPLGNVTVPANHAMPAVGQIVEVEYLYCVKSLYQPCYKGVRTDQYLSDCTAAQIKYRAGIGEDDDVAGQPELLAA